MSDDRDEEKRQQFIPQSFSLRDGFRQLKEPGMLRHILFWIAVMVVFGVVTGMLLLGYLYSR